MNDDGVASNGVTTQSGGKVERFSDENFFAKEVASNSSGDVSSVGVAENRRVVAAAASDRCFDRQHAAPGSVVGLR